MRISGTGCVCDKCGKPLSSFNVIKIKSIRAFPGKNFATVSSDITTKTSIIADLCDKCYDGLVEYLKN